MPARPPGRPRTRLGAPAGEPRAGPGRAGGGGRPAPQGLRVGDRPLLSGRGPEPGGRAAARRRAGDDPQARLRLLLPHRPGSLQDHQGPRGPRGGPRLGGRQPGELPARDLRRRPAALRAAHGALPHPDADRAAGHRPRRRVRPPHRGLRGDPRAVRRRPRRLRVDDGHLPGAARDPRRGCRPRAAARRDRRHRQVVPAHPGPRRPPRPRRAARTAGVGHRLRTARRALRPRRVTRRPAPARRAASLRRPHLRREPARPHPRGGQLARLPDEPVRQGRRRADGPAQARRPRHPDAVGDGLRGPGGAAGRRCGRRPCR